MVSLRLHLWPRTILRGLLLLVGLVITCNLWVIGLTTDAMSSDLRQVSPVEYGLVLGTSPQRSNGTSSAFFDERIKAAALLYVHGKVQRLILSGTHDRQYYNEPVAMYKALIQLGVPHQAIILDLEGDNTLASIKRARQIVGLSKLAIITQRFHGYRALYISRCSGIDAFVFATENTAPFAITRTLLREVLARVKVLIDLHVLQKQQRSSPPSV